MAFSSVGIAVRISVRLIIFRRLMEPKLHSL
jgi:hypothetical protein